MSPILKIRPFKHLNKIIIYKAGWVGRLDSESNQDIYGSPMEKDVGY